MLGLDPSISGRTDSPLQKASSGLRFPGLRYASPGNDALGLPPQQPLDLAAQLRAEIAALQRIGDIG